MIARAPGLTGADLTRIREDRGWSKTQAAAHVGIGRAAWTRYEAGETPVPLLLSWALAAVAFGLPPLTEYRRTN